MSTEVVAHRMGASAAVAKALEDACFKYGILTVLQRSHFLGQMAQESRNYSTVVENMNYSAKRLAEVWPNRYAINPKAPTKDRLPTEKAISLARSGPAAIANDVYGGRMGNYLPGDGWLFRGQGFKMITGRSNVTKYSMDTYGDYRVLDNPKMLQELPDAVYSGGWYWTVNGLNRHANRDDYLAVGRLINIGSLNTSLIPNGHRERVIQTDRAKQFFKELLR